MQKSTAQQGSLAQSLPDMGDIIARRRNMPWLDARTAYANTRITQTQLWSTPGNDPAREDTDPGNGGARAFGDLSSGLRYVPKFSINRQMKVFGIGSGLVRRMEDVLGVEQFSVLSRAPDFHYPAGYLNRFNTMTMLQDIHFGSGTKTFAPESIVELPGGYTDLTSAGLFKTRAEVTQFRAATNRVFMGIAKADLIIITAGWAEVWFDTAFNNYLNTPPSKASLKEPDRFEFRLLDISANVLALHALIGRIHQLAPLAKILLAVAPTPLNATFLDRDVLISNEYSRACLRAAAEEVYWAYDYVDYFPVYEMVTTSHPDIVWEGDRRNIKNAFTDRLVQAFVARYVDR